jgi:hypothetical protein
LKGLNQMSGSISTHLHRRITPLKRTTPHKRGSRRTPLKNAPLTLRTPRRTPKSSPRSVKRSPRSPRTPRRTSVKRVLYKSPDAKSPASIASPAPANTPLGSPW